MTKRKMFKWTPELDRQLLNARAHNEKISDAARRLNIDPRRAHDRMRKLSGRTREGPKWRRGDAKACIQCHAIFVPITPYRGRCDKCRNPTCEKCGGPRARTDSTSRFCGTCGRSSVLRGEMVAKRLAADRLALVVPLYVAPVDERVENRVRQLMESLPPDGEWITLKALVKKSGSTPEGIKAVVLISGSRIEWLDCGVVGVRRRVDVNAREAV